MIKIKIRIEDYAPKNISTKCDDEDIDCAEFTINAKLPAQRTSYFCKFVNLSDTDTQVKFPYI